MKLAVFGVGNAGAKIVDAMLEFEGRTGRSLFRHAMAVNTAETDLAALGSIPEESRLLVGEADPRSRGHGVGGDPEVGAEVMADDMGEVRRALDGVPIHEVDALLVAAGLGGGTGSGSAPVLIRELRGMYSEPVYALGALPSEDEGGRAALNAARSLQSFVDAADSFVAFDNDAWLSSGDTVSEGYERMNAELAARVVTLLSAGELDGSAVAENAMDSSDIIRTLDVGGVASVAYASAEAEPRGVLDGLRGRSGSASSKKINAQARRAVRSRPTLPCDASSAERVLAVVSGPPGELDRRGVEAARSWLGDECETAEVLVGDDPRPGQGSLSVSVLLSNVTEAPRIGDLQDQASEAQDRIAVQEVDREDAIDDLVNADDLDPVT